MAYDEQLAQRMRAVLGDAACTEKKMFGGLAFMLGGHMCAGIVKDTLMLRLGDPQAQAALKRPHVRAMDFTGRPMKGMVFVDPPGFAKDADLKRWLDQARAFAESLPPKNGKPSPHRKAVAKRAASAGVLKTRTIRQSVTLRASPHDVYEALMDAKQHAAFTGCPARVSRQVGGRFTAMESLRGKNVELIPGRRIVQTWQCDHEGWPRAHYSTLTIELKPRAGGTRLEFTQVDVPAACHAAIRSAWTKYYWRPLAKFLNGPKPRATKRPTPRSSK
jgi:uncharacterized protein YndB with AHSA1/START domain/TfoX/Sxy family transcriptional regulator of competence genes